MRAQQVELLALLVRGQVGDARIDQFDDFDPRQHYQLTVSDKELTATERNHAASPVESADDIDLDLA